MPARKRLLPKAWVRFALIALIAGDLIAGLVLRFWTDSLLWLDEAQSVNISSQPVSQIVHFLRNDGAPPLFYFLLHFWMGVVGHTDADVRAMSGVFAVFAVVASYFAARAWWGGETGWYAAAIVSVLPFAVYFGTETRMYSLVMLLVALILWALRRFLDRPGPARAAVIMVLGTLLLYTQYWGIYFDGALLAYAVIHWWRHRQQADDSSAWLIAGVIGAYVLWLPWLPIFNEQRLHTATPWSAGATIFDEFSWFSGFTVNESVPHLIGSLHSEVAFLALMALFLLGIFGTNMMASRSKMTLNFLGSPTTRIMTFLTLLTMFVALLVAHFTSTAFAPRYAAVVVIPLCFIAAVGLSNLNGSLRILVVLAVLSGGCLWTDKWGIGVQRTQAGEIASTLATAPADSIVFVCPDQLGPSVTRYAKKDLVYIGYPRFTYPGIVDWYDYEAAFTQHKPAQNAARAAAMVSPGQGVYVVQAKFYGLRATCWAFEHHLAKDLHRKTVTLVAEGFGHYYQPMELQVLQAH